MCLIRAYEKFRLKIWQDFKKALTNAHIHVKSEMPVGENCQVLG